MKKRKLILLAVLAALAYALYIHTDGESVLRKTNMREMEKVTLSYSADFGRPYIDMGTLTTVQKMDLAQRLSAAKLRRFFDDSFETDGGREIRISGSDTVTDSRSLIGFHGKDVIFVMFSDHSTARYRILNPQQVDIVTWTDTLLAEKLENDSILPDITLSTPFPEGWRFEKRPPDEGYSSKYLMMNVIGYIHDIYDENGNHIGAIGCNRYDVTDKYIQNRQAIYSAIGVANGYHFSTQPADSEDGFYSTAAVSLYGASATTKVYYAPYMAENAGYPKEERYNHGILCYEEKLNLYVAMEFDRDALTEEQIQYLAERTQILHTD